MKNSSNNQVKLHNAVNFRRKPGISRKYPQNYRKLSKDTNPALRHQRNKNKATNISPNASQLSQLITFHENNRQLTSFQKNKTTFVPSNTRQLTKLQKTKGISQKLYLKNVKIV